MAARRSGGNGDWATFFGALGLFGAVVEHGWRTSAEKERDDLRVERDGLRGQLASERVRRQTAEHERDNARRRLDEALQQVEQLRRQLAAASRTPRTE